MQKATPNEADATLEKLTMVMNRNKRLQAPSLALVPAVAAPPPVSMPAPVQGYVRGLRLKPDEDAKIRQIIQQGLTLNVTLSSSDAIKIALMTYDPQRLTLDTVGMVRAKDRRTRKGQGMTSAVPSSR